MSKSNLLSGLVLLSLLSSTSFGMEVPNESPQKSCSQYSEEEKNKWKIYKSILINEDNKKWDVYVIKNKNKNKNGNFLEDVSFEYDGKCFAIKIEHEMESSLSVNKLDSKDRVELKLFRTYIKNSCYLSFIDCTSAFCIRLPETESTHVPEFLALFYNKNLISDYVVDTLKAHMETCGFTFDDFRLTPETFIIQIEKQISENPTAEEFRVIAWAELNKIQSPLLRQELIWGLAQGLLEQSPVEKPMVMEFLQQITDSSLPFYGMAKQELADLCSSEIIDGESVINRSKKGLICLFQATESVASSIQIQQELTTKIKHFITGDNLTDAPLPMALSNPTVSPQYTVELLDYIRGQELRIRELEQKLIEKK